MIRIHSIEIQGFRAFGNERQTLSLTGKLAVIWGPNSHGKTSLAEALEFLFTGSIARRALTASSQDEFADSLRNAFLDPGKAVEVVADFTDNTGKTRKLRRTLLSDFGKREDCTSKLELDGQHIDVRDLVKMGIPVSEPPVKAPILMQHTLGHVFSAGPQERSNYFKGILEVTDLEDLRSGIAKTVEEYKPTLPSILGELDTCLQIQEISSALRQAATASSKNIATKALSDSAAIFLKNAGLDIPDLEIDRFLALSEELEKRQSRTFPVSQLNGKPTSRWTSPGAVLWDELEKFLAAQSKVQEEEKRLIPIFTEILRIPEFSDLKQPVDCPACDTQNALTPERIAAIRVKLRTTDEFRKARDQALGALSRLDALCQAGRDVIKESLPKFLQSTRKQRKDSHFSFAKLRSLIPSENYPAIRSWAKAALVLAKDRRLVLAKTRDLSTSISEARRKIDTIESFTVVKDGVDALEVALRDYASSIDQYILLERALVLILQAQVGQVSKTQGWKELCRLFEKSEELWKAIQVRIAHESFRKDVEAALREIDAAKERVLEEKFNGLSGEIERWWNTLRPNEPTFFQSLRPRPNAKRTIDFKAGIATTSARQDAKLRDVIAVFSHSQLHCLGLATFLAKAAKESSPFVILDDPVQSADEDHRAHFVHTAIPELHAIGIQIILLTQVQKLSKDIEDLHGHAGVDAFELTMEEPVQGTSVVKTSDSLGAMLARAKPYTHSQAKSMRKAGAEQLRDAGERFCKELIVRGRRQAGDMVTISDLDGKTLEALGELAEKYLTDPSHPGKVRALRRNLNPGKHDDDVPAQGVLAVSHGDLVSLRKFYFESPQS